VRPLRLTFAKIGQSATLPRFSWWDVSNQAIASSQTLAASMSVTLNAFMLGTLASCLHKNSQQCQFAISQTYLGRGVDELHVIGSFSFGHPVVFDFSETPSLEAVCKHIMIETQHALAVGFSGEPVTTVAYEFTDVRPIPRPAEAQRMPVSTVVADLMFMVNQFADGFNVTVAYDASKFVEEDLEMFIQQWQDEWK